MAAPRDIAFKCSCGGLTGTLRGVTPQSGTHAVCFCTSCRAGEVYGGQPDPEPAPVRIFQTTPDLVQIVSGAEHLGVFSFGEKNLLRWQATCCGTPLFNTMRSAKMAFVGIRTNCLADTAPLGPVVARGFVPKQNGKMRHEGLHIMIWRMVKRSTVARLSGRWKNNLFFDATTGNPARPVTVVSDEERRALL